MINFAVVEDNPKFLKQIFTYLDRYHKEYHTEFQIESYTDGESFLAENYSRFDVVFLDIILPGKNGMEIAQEIRKRDAHLVIVFITNMVQYAVKGYSVNALDYILKPITYPSFCLTIDKILSALRQRTDIKLTITVADGIHRIPVSAIFYLEVSGHNVIFHTSDGIFTVRSSLKELEETLSDRGFSKCNKCYLVNLRHVTAVTRTEVTVGDADLQMSRRSYPEFIKCLTEFIGKEIS